MDGCDNYLDGGGLLSQCMSISSHHDMHFKYLGILFVNYTSIKLKKKKKNIPQPNLRLLPSSVRGNILVSCTLKKREGTIQGVTLESADRAGLL